MKVTFEHDFARSEFDWIGVDTAGVLGYFSTAGAGPIPVTIATDAALFDSLPEDVLALVRRGQAIQHQARSWDVTEWLEVARRGLFAYDWDIAKRRYDLVARPSSPLSLDDVGHDRIRRIGSLVVFAARFADVTSFAAADDVLRAAS